jgi:hypothetical protein
MAIESALLGGILGGVARMVPEVLKFWDRKSERKHEILLGDQQYKLIQLQGNTRLAETQMVADANQIVAGVDAIKTAYQTMKTGFKFADTVSSLIRPFITIVVFGGWVAVKVAAFMTLSHAGIDWNVAIQTLWGESDWVLLGGVTNFWFLSRVFEKNK